MKDVIDIIETRLKELTKEFDETKADVIAAEIVVNKGKSRMVVLSGIFQENSNLIKTMKKKIMPEESLDIEGMIAKYGVDYVCGYCGKHIDTCEKNNLCGEVVQQSMVDEIINQPTKQPTDLPTED